MANRDEKYQDQKGVVNVGYAADAKNEAKDQKGGLQVGDLVECLIENDHMWSCGTIKHMRALDQARVFVVETEENEDYDYAVITLPDNASEGTTRIRKPKQLAAGSRVFWIVNIDMEDDHFFIHGYDGFGLYGTVLRLEAVNSASDEVDADNDADDCTFYAAPLKALNKKRARAQVKLDGIGPVWIDTEQLWNVFGKQTRAWPRGSRVSVQIGDEKVFGLIEYSAASVGLYHVVLSTGKMVELPHDQLTIEPYAVGELLLRIDHCGKYALRVETVSFTGYEHGGYKYTGPRIMLQGENKIDRNDAPVTSHHAAVVSADLSTVPINSIFQFETPNRYAVIVGPDENEPAYDKTTSVRVHFLPDYEQDKPDETKLIHQNEFCRHAASDDDEDNEDNENELAVDANVVSNDDGGDVVVQVGNLHRENNNFNSRQ